MMELTWSWAIALGTLLLMALIQVIAFRHFAPADRFRFLRRLFGLGLVAAAAGAYLAYPALEAGGWPREGVLLEALVALGFVFLLTLSFYTAVDGSVRVRMLMALIRSQGRGTRDELVRDYGPSTLARRRIEKMRVGGMLEPRGEGDVLTGKGRAMSVVIAAIKRFLRLGIGGM
jgi:hypothetical protein